MKSKAKVFCELGSSVSRDPGVQQSITHQLPLDWPLNVSPIFSLVVAHTFNVGKQRQVDL